MKTLILMKMRKEKSIRITCTMILCLIKAFKYLKKRQRRIRKIKKTKMMKVKVKMTMIAMLKKEGLIK